MTSGESPAVARRRVRLALRAAREERGLTQGDVAKALDWSLSKIQRIESGEVSISTTDLRAILAFLQITEQGTVDQLMDDARTSRRQRWFTDPKLRKFLTAGTRQLLQFESEASAIRSFAPTLVPGMLQTAEYARWAIRSIVEVLPPDEAEARHEVRMKRRGQVVDRDDPPDYFLVLDESVLHREVGGAEVTAEQLYVLLEVSRMPSVRVRVIPFAQAATVALLGPFTILELGEDEDAVLYRETFDDDEINQNHDEIQHHRTIFDALWARSLGEEASQRLINARAATILSSLDIKTFPG